MEKYKDIRTTVSFEIEFRIETSDIKSNEELINQIQITKDELNAEIRKTIRKMDCIILD